MRGGAGARILGDDDDARRLLRSRRRPLRGDPTHPVAAGPRPAPPEARRERMPPPEAGAPYVFGVVTGAPVGYAAAVEARRVKGGFGVNPTAVWIRPRVPLVLGEPLSPLARGLIAADSGNGRAAGL